MPGALLLAFAADFALRALPLDYFSFRAWEALRVGGDIGPFRPDSRYANARAYGDLANLGNLPGDRAFHAETVTTDAFGFRNLPAAPPAGWGAVLTGTSFSAGTEVTDDETLAAQIGKLIGAGVYNAALAEWDYETLIGIVRRVRPARGVLIFEYLEGRGPPSIMLTRDVAPVGRCPQLLAAAGDVCAAWNWAAERARVSPVRIVSQRMLRRLQNDRWLPNPDRAMVTRGFMPDGRPMLFEASEWTIVLSPADEERIVRYFTWLDRRLRADSIRLLVVLAPKKHTVYGRWLEQRRDEESGAESLARIAAALEAKRVPVVNLTEALRTEAEIELAAGRFVYFLDDTHWNAAGIAAAARVIAPALRAMAP